jgi:hypothetical protein
VNIYSCVFTIPRQQQELHPEEFPVAGSIAGFSPIRMGTDDNKE